MSDEALYVYGIVRTGFFDIDWGESGLEGKEVYIIREGEFSALVHDCEEKPYISEEPEKIKKMIITHNEVLNRAIADFGGVIPVPFNTIIKKGERNSEDSLRAWLGADKDRLERIWNKVEGKKEYGLRIYYEKDRLLQGISKCAEIKEIETSQAGKGTGLGYLLQGKAKDRAKEIAYNRINNFKQRFYDAAKRLAEDVKVNTSKIRLEEEKDLLLSLSLLVDERQIVQISALDRMENEDFSFQLAGPFPPYSFVENENQ